MQQEIDSMEAVSRAVDRITRKGRFAEYELENGIVLSIKPVPPLLLNAVMAEFPDPPEPTVWVEELGRNEPNPGDPQYKKDLQAAGDARDLAVNNIVLAVGTSCKEVPEGLFRPEEDGWVPTVEYATKVAGKQLTVASQEEDPITRYLQWIRWYACETGMDIAMVQSLPYQLAGIREGEIDEVAESFQRYPQRGTDTVSEIEATGGENGHRDNRAARRARPGA